MGLFSRSKDPVQQEIKELRREKDRNQTDLKYSGVEPGGAEWKAAEARNKELNKLIKDAEKRARR